MGGVFPERDPVRLIDKEDPHADLRYWLGDPAERVAAVDNKEQFYALEGHKTSRLHTPFGWSIATHEDPSRFSDFIAALDRHRRVRDRGRVRLGFLGCPRYTGDMDFW